MLPDFIKTKKKIWEIFLTPALEKAKNTDPLLSRVRHTLQHEGDVLSYQTVEGEMVQMDYQKFSGENQITVSEIELGNFEELIKKFETMGESAATQMVHHSFEEISKAVDRVGNSMDAGGKFTPETFFEMIEKIHIDFDEDTGQPLMPSLYVPPAIFKQVKELTNEVGNNPKYDVRYEELIKKKKEEWSAREDRRKLVD